MSAATDQEKRRWVFAWKNGITTTTLKRFSGKSSSVVMYTLTKAGVNYKLCDRSTLQGQFHGTGRRRCRICDATTCQGWGDFCCLCGLAILEGAYDAEIDSGKLQQICDGIGA